MYLEYILWSRLQVLTFSKDTFKCDTIDIAYINPESYSSIIYQLSIVVRI